MRTSTWHALFCVIQASEEDSSAKKRSKHVQRKLESRKAAAKLDQHLEEQFHTGRVYGMLATTVYLS